MWMVLSPPPHFLNKWFDCENATLFLVDESRTRLVPAGDTERIKPGDRSSPKGSATMASKMARRGNVARAVHDLCGTGTTKGDAKDCRTGRFSGRREPC
jgi:hypothetical protein